MHIILVCDGGIVVHLMFRVPVCPLGKHKAHVSHLLPECCAFDFQTCCGCCSGTSGCQGSPAGCGDEQAEGDSSVTGWKQHGHVSAKDNQPYGEATRSALSTLQSTGSVWKTVVSLAEHRAGLPQVCAAAWHGWAPLSGVKAQGRQDCYSISCFRCV